jgi:histidinol-phosphate aminotransferase
VIDLRHHGDAEIAPGLVDLAVNVRPGTPPHWLRELLRASVDDLAAYPDVAAARAAVAARHDRPAAEVLLTAGGAEAFVLLARALRPRRAVVVHPQFTEPEAALRAAGHAVERLVLRPPFTLRGAPHPLVPDDADLVVLGNPTNPTSVLHPADAVAALARPGRVLVVDEAFMDAVPGEPETLTHRRDLPGLVVVRSLTKTWGLAGLRIGYLLADAATVGRLAGAQPLWSVSAPAAVAAVACSSARARAEAEAWSREVAAHRDALLTDLARRVPDATVVPDPRAPFVLLRLPERVPGDDVRRRLRDAGWAVRRGDTFPGLGPSWLRVAVRAPDVTGDFVTSLTDILDTATATTGRPLR